MTISHDIVRLQAEIDHLRQRMADSSKPASSPSPVEAVAVAAAANQNAHSAADLIGTIEKLIEESTREIEQHPRAAVIAAFGIGFALGVASAR